MPFKTESGELLEESGAVHIYGRVTFHHADLRWRYLQTLTDPEPAAKGWFGSAVSISGKWAIVGARGLPDTAGDAHPQGVRLGYIYRCRTYGCRLKQKLMTRGLMYHASEGQVVALSENRGIAGAYMDADMRGSVYILQHKGYNWKEKKYVPEAAGPKSLFGIAVAVSGEYAIVGAYQQDDGAGAAYIFPGRQSHKHR